MDAGRSFSYVISVRWLGMWRVSGYCFDGFICYHDCGSLEVSVKPLVFAEVSNVLILACDVYTWYLMVSACFIGIGCCCCVLDCLESSRVLAGVFVVLS